MGIPELGQAAKALAVTCDPRWIAVANRDRSADGQFFFSVRTTGVYCRPSCPARRANPRNVAFHHSAAEAEQAGFRPCRRCRPDEPPLEQQHTARVARACRLIASAEEMPRLGRLAASVGLSAHHFHRLFKAITGLTPKGYATALRAEKVRTHLHHGASVTEAIYASGFNANSRFYETSNAILGMTPRTFRAGGANTEIRFALGACSLGAILVAQSAKGVCAILLGDDPGALLRDLQDRFPKAKLLGGEAGFEALVAKIVAFVEAPGIGLDLPLDVRGTAFQQRVWQALCEIPPGSTASYAEIARRMGMPKAVRAVASACAANALAVAIPCHRVLRTDGGISGYAWGVARKRALLAREGALPR